MNLTQVELARRVGVSFQQIHKYECACQRMSVAMLCRIARALEAEPGLFLAGLWEVSKPERLGDQSAERSALSVGQP
jgi:transcriptional regulator with XRE-family HTH domain